MIISEDKYNKIYDWFLVVLACSLPFRLPATYLLLIFTVFSIIFYKRFSFDKKKLLFILIVASPFILDILFLWNNSEISEGWKHMEKRLSYLILPILIIGNSKQIDLLKLVKRYGFISAALLLFFLVRFAIVSPELFNKYLKGIHLWEMGYMFANSTGVHAPALNMHIAFVTIVNFYLALHYLFERKIYRKAVLFGFTFLISTSVLLYVNTRLAIVVAFIGLLTTTTIVLFKRLNVVKFIIVGTVTISMAVALFVGFSKIYPNVWQKFTTVTFAHIDKVGKLDEIENPQIEVYNSLVTRLSIWKSSWQVAKENLPFGVGASDGKAALFEYYKSSGQKFLFEYKFPVHNQYLDFLIKFGFLGTITVLLFMGSILYIGLKTKNPITIFFFILFATSNLTDDYMIRFEGIAFSAFWLSIFVACYLEAHRYRDLSLK